jgi:PAS domain S-box-containing protein
MALVGIDGRLLKVNRAFCDIVGYDEHILLTKSFQSLTHSDDLDADFEHRRQLLRGEKRYYHREKRYYHKRGHIVWVQLSVSLVRDSQDEPLYFVAQAQDITERRHMEAELRQSEERYRLLAENTSDLVSLHGLDGQWLYASPSCQWLLGFRPDELKGMNVFDRVHPNDREPFQRFYQSLVQGANSMSITYRIRKKFDNYIWFETLARPIRSSFGNVISIETSSRDVSKRVKTSEELAHQARELARSNADLEQFAYIASHDLQEPLATMIGYLQLLQRRYGGKLDADADAYITFAVDGATRMQTLINGLLTYSRVGTRGSLFEPTDCNIVLDNVLANLTAAIERSGAVINRTALPTVTVDPTQMTSVFQNLIGNALKFHGDTPLEIAIGAERQDGKWVFSVRDNGIGINHEDAETIFRIFQRSPTTETDYPGTGIGLAVCKKIIERHGGRIWVESEPQRGATFFFTIPDSEG